MILSTSAFPIFAHPIGRGEVISAPEDYLGPNAERLPEELRSPAVSPVGRVLAFRAAFGHNIILGARQQLLGHPRRIWGQVQAPLSASTQRHPALFSIPSSLLAGNGQASLAQFL